MIYDSFETFVEKVVIPKRHTNPTHKRLDGKKSGGNREIAGIFRHQNKVWKVHADTHYEPLLLAYEVMKNGQANTFIERTTTSGKGNCLILCESVQQLLLKPRFKHLYIYEMQ